MILGIIKSLIYMLAFFVIMRIAAYIFELIYFLFFNKKKNTNENDKNLNENSNTVKMIQCEKCKTYISKSEAYTSNGKTFCKKEHSE